MDAATAALFPNSFQDSPLGKIPKDWHVCELSQVTSVITKGTTPTQDQIGNASTSDRQITFLRVNAIAEDGTILYEKLATIPESVHKGPLKRSILQANDVVYTIAGTIGRISVIEDNLLPANTNQAVAIVRPKAGIPSEFLLLTMRQQAFQEELHSNVVQAVQANLSLGMISRAKAVFPPPESLARIFQPIDIILKKVRANRGNSLTLAAIRDALLPKLISGEIRVKAEELVAEQP
jgi:type I restriction enzyme, S subunit